MYHLITSMVYVMMCLSSFGAEELGGGEEGRCKVQNQFGWARVIHSSGRGLGDEFVVTVTPHIITNQAAGRKSFTVEVIPSFATRRSDNYQGIVRQYNTQRGSRTHFLPEAQSFSSRTNGVLYSWCGELNIMKILVQSI